MTKELTEEALMKEIKDDITAGFNALAHFVIKDISTSKDNGGYCPTLTGFYASSWKASNSPVVYNESVYANDPWRDKRLSYDATGVRPQYKISPRHRIPKFTIKDTIYIANTAEYTQAAFALSRIPEYATSNKNATIDRAFSDRSVHSYRANIIFYPKTDRFNMFFFSGSW